MEMKKRDGYTAVATTEGQEDVESAQDCYAAALLDEYRHKRFTIGICCHKLCFGVTDPAVGMRHVLHEVSFEALPNRTLGIMGEVSSGKTTLLRFLAGQMDTQGPGRTGSLLTYTTNSLIHDSLLVQQEQKRVATRVYVPQHQAFGGNWTVRETLQDAADLHLLSTEWTVVRREQLVQSLLQHLDLLEGDTADRRVGSDIKYEYSWSGENKEKDQVISGGQRRLLAIGCALVSFPSVLIVDEPTSGLDFAASRRVIQLLQTVAKAGCNVIVSIHQPSAETFALIDDCVVLRRGGGLVYSGPGNQDLVKAFEDTFLRSCRGTNPAEFVFTCLQEGKVVNCAPTFACDPNRHSNTVVDLAPQQQQKGCWRQTTVLMRRDLRNQCRDPRLFWLRLATYVVLSLLLTLLLGGTGDIQDRIAMHYMISTSLITLTVFRLQPQLEEWILYRQETMNGSYTQLPYALAQSITCLPYLVVLVAVCTIIQYSLCPELGQTQTANQIALFVMTYLAALYCTESMLLFVSVVVDGHKNLALLFGGGFLLLGAVLNGFTIPPRRMVSIFYWLHWGTFQTFTLGALLANDLKGLTTTVATVAFNATTNATTTTWTTLQVGNAALEFFEFDDVVPIQWISILVLFSIVFRLGTYLGLWARSFYRR